MIRHLGYTRERLLAQSERLRERIHPHARAVDELLLNRRITSVVAGSS